LNFFKKYTCLLLPVLFLLAGCHTQDRNRLPSLNESYRKTDKLPFGSFIAYKGFQSEFSKYWINTPERPFDKTWSDIKDDSSKYSLYFLITKNLILSIDEVNAMVEYVKAGNDLFISADYIDPKLLEAVYCSLHRTGEIISEVNGKMHDTHVSLYYGNDFSAVRYSYYYFPFLNYFDSFDTSYTRVLGVNENNLPDYIVLFAGKGRLYLHAAPRSFSNYFLLTKDNYSYFEYVTSYLRFDPEYVYWDEYYKNFSSTRNKKQLDKSGSNDDFSSLSVIEQHPSLLWAFYIALAGILLFVLFNLKRKQKPIEVIKPNTNATVAFTETIGRLYFQQKNNKNIAEKMITYFYEYLRKKYFINNAGITLEFVNSLSRKSGVPVQDTHELFELIKKIQQSEDVADNELIDLDTKIENFKKINNYGRKLV
jgi:hypothetical protein